MADPEASRPCPFCGEPIKRVAVKCRHCGEYLDEDGSSSRRRRQADLDPAVDWLVPINRSGYAIASGYLGLLSCFPLVGLLFGIGGIVTGLLALRDCRQNPRIGGRGRAIFGIVMGAIAGLGNLLLTGVVLYGWATNWK